MGILTPAGNSLHLGMGGNADDDGGSPLFLSLGDDFVDALDIGAGGVLDHGALGFQSLVDRPGNPVATDNHLSARGDL